MPIDPSIIANSMSNIASNMPDVNALMQQRVQGAENIYKIETARQEQAAEAEKEAAKQAAEAMLPAVAAAFSDPSDGGLDAATSLLPPEVASAFTPFMQRLKGIPDPKQRMAILRAELAKDDEGRYILGQLEPTANMRLQAETAAGSQSLAERRLALDILKHEAEVAGGPEASYKDIVLDDGTLVLMDTKSGKFIKPTLAGPIDTALPPDETAGKPLKVRQKDGAAASESERLAAYNSGRVLQAAEDIVSAIQTDPTAISPGNLEAAVGNVADPNIVRSAERQQVVSAQRELIDALLTLATGAAYNREQREGQIEGFVPKWSDKPAQVKSKLNRTLKTIEIAKVKSGRAWTPEMDAAFQQLIKTFGVEEGETAPPTAAAPPAEGTSVSNW